MDSSTEEELSLSRLQRKLKEENVVALKADKGNTTVLMRKEVYLEKTLEFIENNGC